MPDFHPSEDKAAQYLLGSLSDADRRAFEAELANSPELRALLRELEESSVLLAASAPQRRAPAKVWQSIEKNIARDVAAKEPVRAHWTTQMWLGWAAAALILFGWFLYAFWTIHPNSSDLSRSSAASETASAGDERSVAGNSAINREHPSATGTSPARPLASVDSQELLRLRRQVTELQNRVTNLSQAVAQQQALLGESNRIRFFQVVSTAGSASPAVTPPLSPALQRALFLAMARELGWTSPTDGTFSGTNTAGLSAGNVDFVDFRPATNGPPKIIQPQPQPNSQTANHPAPESPLAPNSPPIAIPTFTSGDNVVVAIDPSIVPAGTQVNFLNQDQQPIGSATIGDNPMVFTVPSSVGGTVYFTTGSLTAPWSVFQILNSSYTIP